MRKSSTEVLQNSVASFNPSSVISSIISENYRAIALLISVGQPYHEREQWVATMDLLAQLIRVEQNVTQTSKRWRIVIIIADTLQAYNTQSQHTSLATEQERWRQKGQRWLEFSQAVVNNLFEDLLACVDIAWVRWADTLNVARKECEFKHDYFKLLRAFSDNAEFRAAVRTQACRYLHKRNYKAQLEGFKLSENNKTYILEELALLMGCMSRNLFFQEHDSDSNKIFLLYPNEIINSFQLGQQLLKRPNSKNIVWCEVNLRTREAKKEAFRGYADKNQRLEPQNVATNAKKMHQVLTDLGIIRGKISDEFYVTGKKIRLTEKYWLRPSYREYFVRLLNQESSMLILYGLRGMGKNQMVANFFNECVEYKIFNKCIVIEADSEKNLKKQINAVCASLGIGDKNCNAKMLLDWLAKTDNWLLVLKDVENYALVTDFLKITRLGCVCVITSYLEPPAPWINCCSVEVSALSLEESDEFIESLCPGLSSVTKHQLYERFQGYIYPLALALENVRESEDVKRLLALPVAKDSKPLRKLKDSIMYKINRNTSNHNVPRKILFFMAYLSAKEMPRSLLIALLKYYEKANYSYELFKESLRVLNQYKLIEEYDEIYTVHSLLLEAFKEDCHQSQFYPLNRQFLPRHHFCWNYCIALGLSEVIFEEFIDGIKQNTDSYFLILILAEKFYNIVKTHFCGIPAEVSDIELESWLQAQNVEGSFVNHAKMGLACYMLGKEKLAKKYLLLCLDRLPQVLASLNLNSIYFACRLMFLSAFVHSNNTTMSVFKLLIDAILSKKDEYLAAGKTADYDQLRLEPIRVINCVRRFYEKNANNEQGKRLFSSLRESYNGMKASDDTAQKISLYTQTLEVSGEVSEDLERSVELLDAFSPRNSFAMSGSL